jgi:tuftelin-interacting protein 11
MTPYESLMWNAWMPKIRTVINNNWSPEDPQPLIRVYEAWNSFLPPFIRDNFFDQLVLPKVLKAVAEWNPRKTTVSLRTLVFPWLPHVGLRVESLLEDARRKIKAVLRAWTPADDVPPDLASWREVFDAPVWDNMILKYVVPKLGARLRDEFKVDPRRQDLAPLEQLFAWETLLRPTMVGGLLEAGFFPQWLNVLHIWLVAPQANWEEIAGWYTQWKGTFPERVRAIPAVHAGFTQGQQLMSTALSLGREHIGQLPKPVFAPAAASARPAPKAAPAAATAPIKEITFRDIVEEHAAAHNLLFIPAGKVHERSRMALFKVTTRADGRGGLLVYIEDDAVWAADGDEWRAISLEDMVVRAMKGGV